MKDIKNESSTMLITLAYQDPDFRKYIDTIHSFENIEENKEEIDYLKQSLAGLMSVYYDYTFDQEVELYNIIDAEFPKHS